MFLMYVTPPDVHILSHVFSSYPKQATLLLQEVTCDRCLSNHYATVVVVVVVVFSPHFFSLLAVLLLKGEKFSHVGL